MPVSITGPLKTMPAKPGHESVYRRRFSRGLLVFWLVIAAVATGRAPVAAVDPKDTFFRAQSCYEDLREHPKKQKYRSNWFPCIEKFRSVYNMDPDGQWAAAGLYMTGRLYHELYKKSYLDTDLQEAADLFRRITLRFPKSRYSPKAAAALKTISRSKRGKKVNLSSAVSDGTPYGRARAARDKLKKNPRKQKYRENWFAVIRKFETIYKKDPGGPAAAASLYATGELYLGLSEKSYLTADRREAVDILRRVTSRFEGTPYAEKAKKKLAALENRKTPHQLKKQKPAGREPPLKKDFEKAEKSYRALVKSKKRSKYRDQWKRIIRNFQNIHERNPDDFLAPAALFRAAECWLELYRRSYLGADREKGLDLFTRVMENYPRSPYRSKAAAALKENGRKIPASTTAALPKNKDRSEKVGCDTIAQQILKSDTEGKPAGTVLSQKRPPGIVTVTGLRYWSNPNYTRIVIDASSETEYAHRLLKQDRSLKKPQRLYIDLKKARLARDTKRNIPINDNLLIDARAGQYEKDAVRVVVDIKSFRTYKIFPLKNPFRIVIDVRGDENNRKIASKNPGAVKYNGKIPPGAIARQFSLGVSRIVVDPGHGGRDYGATGYYKGVYEKNIVLQIGKRLAVKIRKELGCEVLMTRTTDKYLTLEERTAFANTKNADLFISIHTNAIRDKRAYGVETYFLNLATDEDAIRVAARENATSRKNISDLQTILTDLMQNAKINESSRLAVNVQDSVYYGLRKHYSKVKSKGVKQAPFYVLLGAQMPAVLVETSFISNPRECRRLTNLKYQERLCDGIIRGIKAYIKAINPTALSGKSWETG